MNQQEPEKNTQSEREEWQGRHHHRERNSAIFAGIFLVLLGVLLFLSSQGMLPWDQWWKYLLIGIGTILLISGLIDNQKERMHWFGGRVIAGIILICIGLAFLLGAANWWPLILIIIGIGVIVGGLTRSDKNK